MEQVPNNGKLLQFRGVAAAHTERADPSPCLASWHPCHKKLWMPASLRPLSECLQLLPSGRGLTCSHFPPEGHEIICRVISHPLTWLGPVSPPISFFTDPINSGAGFAGALALWPWLVPSWAMLPSSVMSLCPALGAATLAQEEKPWPLEHVQESGQWDGSNV